MPDEQIYYGVVDCFLFDNAISRHHNNLMNSGLIHYESNSMDAIIKLLNNVETATTKKVIKDYKNMEEKPNISDHLKLHLSDKYIIKYTKDNGYLNILDKRKFDNIEVNKYLQLM